MTRRYAEQPHQRPLRARERDVAARETSLKNRERISGEHDASLAEREEVARLRDVALRARSEADDVRADREELLAQMRDANEKLVIATMRADELADESNRAKEVEAQGRVRAEALTAQVVAGEQALRESEEQFRTLANMLPSLAWYTTAEGEITWLSDRWQTYSGLGLKQLVETQYCAMLESDDLVRMLTKWRAALAEGTPWEDTFQLRRHDGELRWFLGRALPLRNEESAIARWIGTMVDVDDQKRAEEHLRSVSRAKDEFLAMLGHELRNPLAPILTALDLMGMQDSNAFARERAIVERQVRYMVRLVDDLLDVSRIAGGKIELEREPIELAAIVARAAEMASPLVEKKGHHMTVDVAHHGLTVHGDPVRLAQVVTNLLTNAAKYTPDHGSIAVIGERRGSTIWLRIRDNGIGISAEMLPHVFELFAQEHQVLDRARGGLGLGLAIVENLVAMHDGSVTAHSDGIGKGSEFAIELPAMEAASSGEIASAVACDEVLCGLAMVGRKILVVDDNQDAAELMADSLRAMGNEVRVAFDGPSALSTVDDFVPAIALLDIGLPVMDGYELAAHLRVRLAPHAIAMIAITGYGRDDDRARSRQAGFAIHLVKPVDRARLREAVQQVSNATSSL